MDITHFSVSKIYTTIYNKNHIKYIPICILPLSSRENYQSNEISSRASSNSRHLHISFSFKPTIFAYKEATVVPDTMNQQQVRQSILLCFLCIHILTRNRQIIYIIENGNHSGVMMRQSMDCINDDGFHLQYHEIMFCLCDRHEQFFAKLPFAQYLYELCNQNIFRYISNPRGTYTKCHTSNHTIHDCVLLLFVCLIGTHS